VRSLDEIFVLQCWDTSLASLLVHFFQLGNRVLLHLALNHFDDVLIVRQIGAVALQTNHIQRRRGFQRTMNMVELAGVLSLVQVGRHASVAIRLGSQ
jgi:hypothetical protein